MNTETFDQIEFEYEAAIKAATRCGDNNAALELSIGLSQYQKFYKPGVWAEKEKE